MGYFCPRNTFLQLKHIQRIYPTLLSTSCMKTQHSLSICFSWNITYFLQKWPIKVKLFRLATVRIKIHQIPHVIFGNKSQFFFKLCITLSCHMRHDFFIWISASFGQAHPIKVPIFRLSSARKKINQIAYVIFQPTSQFSLKLCNALQCHDT